MKNKKGGAGTSKGLRRKRAASRRERGINRRDFLTYSASTGLLLGMSPLLPGCGSDNGSGGASNAGGSEQRTYLFDFSHMETEGHELILVAGRARVQLQPITASVLGDMRQRHPILSLVPDEHITHFVQRDWPASAIQLCYVQRRARQGQSADWDMAMLFFHLPISALDDARARRRDDSPLPVKWVRYGLTPALRAELNDPLGEDMLKDTTDQATALVAGYPELSSGEPNSAAHIQSNIIATQSSTQLLGQVIAAQGPATTTGGWATQTPLINSATNEPYLNSQNQIQYMPLWSQETSQFAGQAITPALTTAKNDMTLGSNITEIDPEQITSNDVDAPTNGTVWTLHDGSPSVDQSATQGVLQDDAFSFQLTNQSPDNGYSASVVSVDENRNITVELKNWYVRTLGFYLRYLDGSGQPIPLSTIENEILSSGYFPFYSLDLNGEFDIFVNLVNPEWVVLGMPVGTTVAQYTFPMPSQAVSVQLLCGGLGSGSNPYPATLDPGKIMTIVFQLAVPSIFLALAAAPGFPRLQEQLEQVDNILWVLQLTVDFFEADFADIIYDDPSGFASLAVEIGEKLLDSAAERLDALIAEAISEGEEIEAVEDAVPVIGLFLAAISAVGLVAQIAETSAQVAQSPQTYATEVTFTHDIAVTIAHDPNDPSGFPAVATSFKVTALFDNGSPQTITQELPSTTVTTPIEITFKNVPYGGQVSVNVGFYSDNGWLAGNGSIGPVANTSDDGALALGITITENLVPLEPDTLYNHKEIIVLDASGNHEWKAQSTPPAVATTQGQCESANGQLCSLTGITVSTVNAAVGYTWQSYNSQVGNCANGGVSQLHQFANLSTTESPQSGYLFSGCGFSGTVRIVYDLLGKQDWNFYLDPTQNVIRQVRLSGSTADFDGPESNKAWGKLQFSSDAMLLHPAGRIISVNAAANKIELITLPASAVSDAAAPLSQVYSGTGIREGLMDGPTLAALAPDGTILILETKNNRIQAFDLGANPVPQFMEGAYYVPLHDEPTAYLDLAVEYTGYMYVLSYTGQPGSLVFRLDIYTPQGDFLARTTGFNAAKLAVNYWRDLYALNYQVLRLPDNSLPDITEPSVSHWIPSTPSAA